MQSSCRSIPVNLTELKVHDISGSPTVLCSQKKDQIIPLSNGRGSVNSCQRFGYFFFCISCGQFILASSRRPASYFDKVNLSQRTTQKLRSINKEISPGDKHISRLPLERGSLLNKNAYSMVCFSAAMRALLPENASPYLIIDLIPNACISAL